MYGDTEIMRRRARQLREQGSDIRMTADRLVAQTEGLGWTGRAAESMHERVRARATHLREAASRHDSAADALDHHLHVVEGLKETIDTTERKASSLVADARARVARLARHDLTDPARPAAVRVLPDAADDEVVGFEPPAPGHRDWLTVTLPGL